MNQTVSFDLLGSTGSIGKQALDVARQLGFRVISLSANQNAELVETQAREFHPFFCAMADEQAAADLKLRLADTDIRVFAGASGITEMIAESRAEVSLNATIGEAGLLPTLAVIRSGKRLALANKESLVVAGELVMKEVATYGTCLTPVDSEHCAIHQCLRAGNPTEIKRLIVTASGGPFFGKTKEDMKDMTAAQALAHPTWSMGAKITVDSATLMNKGFELIEAGHLFGIGLDRITALVHRESIIHSMVEYIDNSVMAQMSVPDMRFCIRYGLEGGARGEAVIPPLDLTKVGALSFHEPDRKAFPLLDIAINCGKIGGGMPAVLNAANEVAVEAFLKEKIRFGKISEIVMQTVSELGIYAGAHALEEFLLADKTARIRAAELCLKG